MKNIVESILNIDTDKTNKHIEFAYHLADVTFDITKKRSLGSDCDLLGKKVNVGDYVIFAERRSSGKSPLIGFGCVAKTCVSYCEIIVKQDKSFGVFSKPDFDYADSYMVYYESVIKVSDDIIEKIFKVR